MDTKYAKKAKIVAVIAAIGLILNIVLIVIRKGSPSGELTTVISLLIFLLFAYAMSVYAQAKGYSAALGFALWGVLNIVGLLILVLLRDKTMIIQQSKTTVSDASLSTMPQYKCVDCNAILSDNQLEKNELLCPSCHGHLEEIKN